MHAAWRGRDRAFRGTVMRARQLPGLSCRTPRTRHMAEQTPNRVTRRQALRRIAAAGAVAWAVPAVQTINMTRAFAQTQASNPKAYSWFRISRSDLAPDGSIGACGGPISPTDTCLSSVGANDCSPVLGTPSTPSGSDWTVCFGLGYEVQ